MRKAINFVAMTENERRIAIVDLGTNTFNLLIVALFPDGTWKELFRNSIPVKLAEGGITRHTIAKDRYYRGVDVMQVHRATIDNYRCAEIHAYATSAVREALNGVEFTKLIAEKTDISVKIIDGNVEAELIHDGVRQTLPATDDKLLIMDIGGGSTEFILSDGEKITWKASFPLGVSRIKEVLQPEDPLGKTGKKELEDMLIEVLEPLWESIKQHHPKILVGASGSFKTFRQILEKRQGLHQSKENPIATEFQYSKFQDLARELFINDYKYRLNIPGMHPMRADTLHLSAIMTELVLKRLDINRLYQSGFALKEGVALRVCKERME